MRLEQAEIYHVALELVHPFQTSFGVEHKRELIVIRLDAGGYSGWGESPVMARPGYSYETVATAWSVLKDHFLPSVLGEEVSDPLRLAHLWRKLKGHPMARAGVELALWDLLGKSRGLSLQAMLGGSGDQVAVGVSIGIHRDIQELLERVGTFVEQGYQRIKIKIEPGYDLEPVNAIRSKFPEVPMQIDANAAYSLAELETFIALDDQNLTMIEQPFGHQDLIDHSRLQAAINTPICLDESITSDQAARQAIEIDAARIINIKQARVGGLSEAIRIHDRCQEAGVPVWCGGLLETGIGRSANLALASLPGFTLPGDISATDRYYARDLAQPSFTLDRGHLPVPQQPGLGVEVDLDFLKVITLRRQRLQAD